MSTPKTLTGDDSIKTWLDHPVGGPIIRDLLDAIIEQAVVSTALIDLIWTNRHDEHVVHLSTRLARVAETVLAREHAAGRIGDHVETEDVLLAITMLADVLARTDVDGRRAVARRAWSLFHAAFAPR